MSARPSAAYLRALRALYGSDEKRERFRPERLPDPAEYYRARLHGLRVRGAWADAICPLHHDSCPSLSVSLEHGGFLCRGCGARGGDVLAFERALTGAGFVEAARRLGAWEDS